jgi:hypothetical protein
MQVGISTINRDAIYLRQQAHRNLQNHIQQKLPEEYQRCLTGINQVLKLSWQIANADMNGQQEDSNGSKTITTITEKDKIRLQAAALANDCYKYIMDLTTNGVVITDAIKFVQTNKEKLTMSTKEEKGSKESREPDYDEDEDQDQLEEEQEKETGEVNQEETTNQVF